MRKIEIILITSVLLASHFVFIAALERSFHFLRWDDENLYILMILLLLDIIILLLGLQEKRNK